MLPWDDTKPERRRNSGRILRFEQVERRSHPLSYPLPEKRSWEQKAALRRLQLDELQVQAAATDRACRELERRGR
jgi:hypothetical protein